MMIQWWSISIGGSLRLARRIEDCWVCSYFDWTWIFIVEIVCSLRVCQFQQVFQNVISASVCGLVPLSVAWIVLVGFYISEAFVWIVIVLWYSVLVVYLIAFEPLFESHCAHHVVVRHWIKWVESVLNWFFGRQTYLEWVSCTCSWFSNVVENFCVFETPRFKNAWVWIIRLSDKIFLLFGIEEEYLYERGSTLL